MATTSEIIKAAQELGKLVATHDATKKFRDIVSKLQKDVDAQRLLTDYQRMVMKVSQKEAEGRPIEVEEKRQLEKMSQSVSRNLVLGQLQMSQMDYLDLMRQVDEAIEGQTELDGGGGAAPKGPSIVTSGGGGPKLS